MIPSFSAYHVFAAHLGGSDYRCSAILDDASFENLMDMMHWKMPYNLCAYHRADRKQIAELSTLTAAPELPVPLDCLLTSHPPQTMNLKDKRRQATLPILWKCGSYVIADTEDGYGRFYCVDGITSSLVTKLEAVPVTLREASAYIDRHHRHNAGPQFHKFSICLRAPGEPEPVGVAVASTPKARHQMDGKTLEINRCCADMRYANVCSQLYASAIRIGRELGYRRFLTYTLPDESGSSLKAVGFHLDGTVKPSSYGWDSPSRPRDAKRYPYGEKLRWVYNIA